MRPTPPECTHWIGAEQRHCRATDGVRQFANWWACPEHTPRALLGLPELPPGPGYKPQTLPTPQSASALVDNRAVASGKRRSSPHEYKAARAAVDRRTS